MVEWTESFINEKVNTAKEVFETTLKKLRESDELIKVLNFLNYDQIKTFCYDVIILTPIGGHVQNHKIWGLIKEGKFSELLEFIGNGLDDQIQMK